MARSPLFDIYDPYGILSQQADLGLLTDEEDPLKRRQAQIADLLPEEERTGLLRSLANVGTSGLAGLGWILDTPGAMVRGTLSAGPMKGLSALWESSDDRVTGRELLRQYGLVGRQDTWGNFAGSLGAEVLLDPLSYVAPWAILGKGAKGVAGRAAERAGLLENANLLARRRGEELGRNMGIREYMLGTTPRQLIAQSDNADAFLDFANAARGKGQNVDDLLDQPLAGLAEFRIPGFDQGYLVGSGEFGQRVGRAIDSLGEGMKRNPYTAPVVNRLTRAFDPTVMERLDPDDQWRAREAFAQYTQNERNFREEAARQYLDAARAAPGFDDRRIQNAIRDTIEAQIDPSRVSRLQDKQAIELLESVPEWTNYRGWLRDALADAQARRAGLGLETPSADSIFDTGFFPRQIARFNTEDIARIPDTVARTRTPYERGQRIYTVDDLVGKSRKTYLDLDRPSETLRRLMSGDFGAGLRDRLFGAENEQIPGVIDEAFQALGLEAPYARTVDPASGQSLQSIRDYLADTTITAADRQQGERLLHRLERNAAGLKVELGDLLRSSDRQFAPNNMGMFDRHTMEDIMRYGAGGARSEANASVLLDSFERLASDVPADRMPGGGATNLLEAAAELGFHRGRLREILQARMPGRDIDQLSISSRAVQDLKAISPLTPAPKDSLTGNLYRSFTNAFKIGALANPAYHTRNLYSGFLATLMRGGIRSPADLAVSSAAGMRAGAGNYDWLYTQLRDVPRYQHLAGDREELIRTALADMARNRLGQGQIFEDVAEAGTRNIVPGMDRQEPLTLVGDGGLFYDPNRSWTDWATVRGVDFAGAASGRRAPVETLNPWLRLHERVGRRVEDANRLGNYIEMLRQGASPDAAAANVFRTQVDYSPSAFTNFERGVKQAVPFYSYTRGIAPFVAENVMYRPGGLQGQTVRAITRGSQPTEDYFLPEHLRQSAAIPLPGLSPNDTLERVVNNLDLPYEGLVNLITPGVGNTFTQRAYDTVRKTGMNLLGQLNPIIKAPLEMILDRQLYTGRELSDLYSVLEQDLGPIGRPLEQLLVNFVPGGTRLNSIYRTARDSRLSAADRAAKLLINNTLGLKVTDYDKEKAREKAARAMLNELLQTTPGVRTYENLTVPDEALRSMSPDQQQMYLLYKVLQSEASKRSRERKKAEELADPLRILGVTR